MSHSYLFTSESVSEGHPDKIADQISDAVLDAILAQDARARVACETLVKTGFVMVAGEVTSRAEVRIEDLVRRTILDIGYDGPDLGFDGSSCGVLTALGRQSGDISQGVSEGEGAAGVLGNETGLDRSGSNLVLACDVAHCVTDGDEALGEAIGGAGADDAVEDVAALVGTDFEDAKAGDVEPGVNAEDPHRCSLRRERLSAKHRRHGGKTAKTPGRQGFRLIGCLAAWRLGGDQP